MGWLDNHVAMAETVMPVCQLSESAELLQILHDGSAVCAVPIRTLTTCRVWYFPVAGVMYVCIHGASNVKAADKTGASDPYCVLFCNRRRVGAYSLSFTCF